MTADQPGAVDSVGRGLTVSLVNTVIVYDRKDGRVVHVHRFTTIGSGSPRTDEDMEQKALGFLKTPSHDSGPDFAVLHLRQRLLKPKASYRVDLTTSQLIEAENASSPSAEKQLGTER
jgi:hypothetical protein